MDFSSTDEEAPVQTSPSWKKKKGKKTQRTRGRPPTKGYGGVGKARKMMAEAKKRETQLRARNEILESELKKREAQGRWSRDTQRGVASFGKDSEEGRR